MTATRDFHLVLLAIALAVTISYTGIAQGRARHLWLDAIAKAIVEEELQAWNPNWGTATYILSNLN